MPRRAARGSAPPGPFDEPLRFDVYANGGRTPVREREAVGWAREAAERGAGELLLTSIDRDGTGEGYDLELNRAVADAVAVPVIASGGAGRLDHLVEAITQGGADAVLCASIFHYGEHTVREAKRARSKRVNAASSTAYSNSGIAPLATS